MKEENNKIYAEDCFHKISKDNYILSRGDYHRLIPEYDERQVRKKPSKLKRLLRTFI